MTKSDVKEFIALLKPRKCEGFDRLSVCMIYNAIELLLEPMAWLFRKIYTKAESTREMGRSKNHPNFQKRKQE